MRKKTSITAVAGTVLILMVLALASCTGKSGTASVGGSSAAAGAAGTNKISISASAVSSSAFGTSSVSNANSRYAISDAFFTKLDAEAKNVPARAQSSSIDPDLGQGKGRSSNVTVGQGSGVSNGSTINGSVSNAGMSSSIPSNSFPGTENTSSNDNLVFGSDCPMPSTVASLCGRDGFSYGAMVGGACPTFVCVIGLGTGDQADGILGN